MALVQSSQLEHEESGPWPAFADLLGATTLLFLVLFTAVAVPAIRQGQEGREQESRLAELEKALKQVEQESNQVTVQRVGDYMLVRIRGDATFPRNQSGLADLKPEGREILRSFGEVLRDTARLNLIDQIQVVGHASLEGLDDLNWNLSSARAATVSLYLIESVGIPACRLSALGRSRYYPVNVEEAKGGRINPADRRIELEIRPVIPGDSNQILRRQSCVDRRVNR